MLAGPSAGLAGEEVTAFIVALRDLARSRLADVDEVVRDDFMARDDLEPVSRSELVERAQQGKVVILDVRPQEEFAAGTFPASFAIPPTALNAPDNDRTSCSPRVAMGQPD